MNAKMFILAGVMFSSVNALAAKLDCGFLMGMKSTIEFNEHKGDRYGGMKDYVGTYMAPGKDSTTGTLLRSKAYPLFGYKESVTGFGPAYVLMNEQAQLTLFVEAKNIRKGGKVKVVIADLRRNSEDKVTCELM